MPVITFMRTEMKINRLCMERTAGKKKKIKMGSLGWGQVKLNQPGSVFQVADLLVAFLSKEPAPVNTKGIVFPAPSPPLHPNGGEGAPALSQ